MYLEFNAENDKKRTHYYLRPLFIYIYYISLSRNFYFNYVDSRIIKLVGYSIIFRLIDSSVFIYSSISLTVRLLSSTIGISIVLIVGVVTVQIN